MITARWAIGSSYHSDADGVCCPDGHITKQIKQWRQVIQLVEQHELMHGMSFQSVVKIRPDDLWYCIFFIGNNSRSTNDVNTIRFGASLPYCVLDPGNVVYSSKTITNRMSDQWLVFPRRIITPLLGSIVRNFVIECPASSNSLVLRDISEVGSHFENSIERVIEDQKNVLRYKFSMNMQPRILARVHQRDVKGGFSDMKDDVVQKCAKFAPYVDIKYCERITLGRDGWPKLNEKQNEIPGIGELVQASKSKRGPALGVSKTRMHLQSKKAPKKKAVHREHKTR